MIVSSNRAKFVALALAGLAHAAFALVAPGEPSVLIQGGQGAQEVRIGSSFADVSVGTQTAELAEDAVENSAPETVAAPVAEPTPTVTPDITSPNPEPERRSALVPELPDATLPLRPAPLSPTEPETPEPDAPKPSVPELATLMAPGPEPEAEQAEPTETTETIAADAPQDTSVETSSRPRMRDPELALRAERRQTPQPAAKPAAKPSAPRGTASQTATRGVSGGRETATGTRQGDTFAKAAAPGNAAVSNYPGLVNRHLSQVRKPAMNRRGATLVSFSITDAGGLGSLSVRRSSGAGSMDDVALNVIRRAAPFPRPPAGAQRSFSIQIEFR
jgi:protein TonB